MGTLTGSNSTRLHRGGRASEDTLLAISPSTRKQLGQLRPTDTSAASLFSPASGETVIVTDIVICNVSANDASYRIFNDDDGTTFDEGTALFFDVSIRANSTHTIDNAIIMNDSTGSIGVRTDSANDLTFTAYGLVYT